METFMDTLVPCVLYNTFRLLCLDKLTKKDPWSDRGWSNFVTKYYKPYVWSKSYWVGLKEKVELVVFFHKTNG